MRRTSILVHRQDRYSLEREEETGRPLLSIPVRNQAVEYEEHYAISEAELARFLADPGAARTFAGRCGRREMDDRLIVPPGRDRGWW